LKYAQELSSLVNHYKYSVSHHQPVDVLLDLTSVLTKDVSQIARYMASAIQIFERHVQVERRTIARLLPSRLSQGEEEGRERVEKSRERFWKKNESLLETKKV
jgi:hypothetical protein